MTPWPTSTNSLRSAALASMTRKRTIRAANQHALQHPVWQWQPGVVQETGARASFESSIANTRSFEPSPTFEYNSAADLSNDEILDVAFLCHGPTPMSGESSNDSDSQHGPSPNPLPLPPPNQRPACPFLTNSRRRQQWHELHTQTAHTHLCGTSDHHPSSPTNACT